MIKPTSAIQGDRDSLTHYVDVTQCKHGAGTASTEHDQASAPDDARTRSVSTNIERFAYLLAVAANCSHDLRLMHSGKGSCGRYKGAQRLREGVPN
jgi:hypothetical protein